MVIIIWPRYDTSADLVWQVCFWDIASGKEVRRVAASEFAFGAGAEMSEHRTNHHLLKAFGDSLLITELPPHDGAGGFEDGAVGVWGIEDAEPVASFTAPERITSVQCHGATICVGCEGGAVCILQAPFLAV